ncbi:hypothetical protein [Haladaptatus sp. DFWS20]|uniref:hypothetical protein n=1 Tax=Haladaptatus sp. DFWS20 TaxID=3403467 RepID=UPI003EBED3D1
MSTLRSSSTRTSTLEPVRFRYRISEVSWPLSVWISATNDGLLYDLSNEISYHSSVTASGVRPASNVDPPSVQFRQ